MALVLPTGYAFNHDGTCLYFASVSVFLAQAVGIDLSIGQQLGLLAILLVTSKGGAGVAGSAIVVLASTLAATGTIPVASVGLILGVHRLLSSAFVPVNVLGNAIATLVIARMERALDVATFESELRRPVGADVPVDGVELRCRADTTSGPGPSRRKRGALYRFRMERRPACHGLMYACADPGRNNS